MSASSNMHEDQLNNSNSPSLILELRTPTSHSPRRPIIHGCGRHYHYQNKTFPTPFPWAVENKRATNIHSLDELMEKKIETITGSVQCRRCEKQYEIGFDLREKFIEVSSYIADNKESMNARAPSFWMCPVLPMCKFCGQENSVRPVISEKKKTINWLFLLLGQMLGCCSLEQLKYFCKHTGNSRTGAKDRVLYLAYLGLCKQLQPDHDGLFDR